MAKLVAPIVGSVTGGISALLAVLNTSTSLERDNQELHGGIRANIALLEKAIDGANKELLKYEGLDDSLHLELTEVLTEAEDFLVEIAAIAKGDSPKDSRFGTAFGSDRRPSHLKTLEAFERIIKDIKERQRHPDNKSGVTGDLGSTTIVPRCLDLDKGFKDNFCKMTSLLSPVDCKKLRRIAIVGAAGVGKSVLAMEIYEETIVQPWKGIESMTDVDESFPFNVKIWVNASACLRSDDLIREIRKEVDLLLVPDQKIHSSVGYLTDVMQQVDLAATDQNSSSSEIISRFLKKKRFLIIIDNLCSSDIYWKDLIPALPEGSKNSRIIVTTSLHSVARAFASGRYYIYPLQPLSQDCSEHLFHRHLRGQEITNPEKDRATMILHKCGGSPAAITSAKNYVLKQTNPFLTESCCEEICTQLDKVVLTKEASFTHLATIHMKSYESLNDYDERNSLLAFGFYPREHAISMNNFARKLSAESLVAEQNARKCLQQLVDRSIVSNVDKKYQIQGVMLQFARYKVLARNMVTIFDEDGSLWQCDEKVLGREKVFCRRLVIHSSPKNSGKVIPDVVDLSQLRSLTIFKCTDPALSVNLSKVDFKSFTKMRILDLQNCDGFSDNTFLAICQMRLLKYLNLRYCDVANIPKSVAKLVNLETFDIRHTLVRTIPLEVITLPKVKYIFGRFEIPPLAGKEKYIVDFLKDDSKLHTVAGLCVSDTSGAATVVLNARCLRKLKVYGNKPVQPSDSATKRQGMSCFAGRDQRSDFDSSVRDLVESLHARRADLEQLSICSSAIFESFRTVSMDGSILSCFKVEGQITALPLNHLQTIRKLTKICLYDTGMSAQTLAEGLQRLESLEHLKLGREYDDATSWIGDFEVENGGFPALREFCLTGPKKYPNIKVGQGGMRVLVSLQLLCPMRDVPAVDDAEMELVEADEIAAAGPEIRVDGIWHLRFLDEIILHYSTDDAVITVWESLARAHVNLPCVRRQRKPLMPCANDF